MTPGRRHPRGEGFGPARPRRRGLPRPGTKWEFCRKSPGTPKYVICNADEGDPGAFMDRSILESDPHSVHRGHDHRRLRHRRARRATSTAARNIRWPSRACRPPSRRRTSTACWARTSWAAASASTFDLKEGAGAFVCGEETALMASIEGRRGEPRPRPPFPAVSRACGASRPTSTTSRATR